MMFLFYRPRKYTSSTMHHEVLYVFNIVRANGPDDLTRCVICLRFHGPINRLGADVCPQCRSNRG